MRPDALLWHNNSKKSLPAAILEASAAHLRRLGSAPTNVILPLGDYPAELRPEFIEGVGGLKVEVCRTVDKNHLKVYADGQ